MLSLAVHAGLGWWALQVDSPKPSIAAAPPRAEKRLQVQLLTLPPPDSQNALVPSAKVALKTAGKSQIRKPALTPQPEPASSEPALVPLQAGERANSGEVQTLTPTSTPTPTPAAPAQALPSLNLDSSRTITSAESKRRKSPLASAVDAAQSENSQTPEARAFAKLAPAGSNIVSETIMADGSRLIKFSAGGCMRVVNPSSRNHDDIRKSTMENC